MFLSSGNSQATQLASTSTTQHVAPLFVLFVAAQTCAVVPLRQDVGSSWFIHSPTTTSLFMGNWWWIIPAPSGTFVSSWRECLGNCTPNNARIHHCPEKLVKAIVMICNAFIASLVRCSLENIRLFQTCLKPERSVELSDSNRTNINAARKVVIFHKFVGCNPSIHMASLIHPGIPVLSSRREFVVEPQPTGCRNPSAHRRRPGTKKKRDPPRETGGK